MGGNFLMSCCAAKLFYFKCNKIFTAETRPKHCFCSVMYYTPVLRILLLVIIAICLVNPVQKQEESFVKSPEVSGCCRIRLLVAVKARKRSATWSRCRRLRSRWLLVFMDGETSWYTILEKKRLNRESFHMWFRHAFMHVRLFEWRREVNSFILFSRTRGSRFQEKHIKGNFRFLLNLKN